MKKQILIFLFLALCWYSHFSKAELIDDLRNLQKAYPDYVISVSNQSIVWKDGTVMLATDDKPNKSIQEKIEHPALADQMTGVVYPVGVIDLHANFLQKTDPGRIRYEPFFRKMYGNSKEEVEAHLVWIDWMPHVFKDNSGRPLFSLQVTTVNHVDEKLKKISTELEKLPSSLYPYLENPGGTFMWRLIANTDRISNHSFGMTMDINTNYSSYWQWDLERGNHPVNENTALDYCKNRIPWEIIQIFEKYGFIWGGKWYHYDTMHFEYRPELLPPTQ